MKLVGHSHFKNQSEDIAWFYDWKKRLEAFTGRSYQGTCVKTSIGETLVWRIGNPNSKTKVIIFPGFRTSPLIWDLDKGLDYLMEYDLYLIETNGQPNPSSGDTPAIRSLDYGHWAKEVLDQLNLEKVFIAGASFGGLVCMKLALVDPDRVKAAILLNPGCSRFASLGIRNMYYNLLPLLKPSLPNVIKFLYQIVLYKPEHDLNQTAFNLLAEYEFEVIKRYKDRTQKPYNMGKQLNGVLTPTYYLVGDKDPLMPYQKSVENARKLIPGFKEMILFKNVAHGIEVYRPALEQVKHIIEQTELKA